MHEFFDEWNIPEFCKKDAWLGAIFGDSGDEHQNMAGRVIQFTHDRVEKELDTCPWDIVGAELCNMTTAMFTANFDLNSNGENEVALNMCEARGCGNKHCRVVAERRDVYNLPKQGWLDHMQQPAEPVHDTPGSAWCATARSSETGYTPRPSARRRPLSGPTAGAWKGLGLVRGLPPHRHPGHGRLRRGVRADL